LDVDGPGASGEPAWQWDKYSGNIVKLNSFPYGSFNENEKTRSSIEFEAGLLLV
jgi:hypothetical protein